MKKESITMNDHVIIIDSEQVICQENAKGKLDCYFKNIFDDESNMTELSVDTDTMFSSGNVLSWATRNVDGQRIFVVQPRADADLSCKVLERGDRENSFNGRTLSCT